MNTPCQLSVNSISSIRGHRCLFSDLSFVLNPGEVLQVLGSNGSGKTTLLRILAGLLPMAEGAVYWSGSQIAECRYEYAAELTYVGHKPGVKSSLTVLENLRSDNLIKQQVNVDYDMVLGRVGMLAYKNILCSQLSAGQKQRVALGRLLLSNAKLWILDEPLTAIDKAGVAMLMQIIEEYVKQGGMLVLTSHQALDFSGIHVRQLMLGSESLEAVG